MDLFLTHLIKNYLEMSSKPSVGALDSTPHPSIAHFSRRVYPLNLKFPIPAFSSTKKPWKAQVPEFAKEYIKDSTRSQSNKKLKSAQMHKRSVSYNVNPGKKPETAPKSEEKGGIPIISYKDYRFHHKKSNSENRYFKPQVIQLNKRAKIVLYSERPIVINPNLYSVRKSSAGAARNSRVEENEGLDVSLPLGLTYGEKILKLKSLVESTIM